MVSTPYLTRKDCDACTSSSILAFADEGLHMCNLSHSFVRGETSSCFLCPLIFRTTNQELDVADQVSSQSYRSWRGYR